MKKLLGACIASAFVLTGCGGSTTGLFAAGGPDVIVVEYENHGFGQDFVLVFDHGE